MRLTAWPLIIIAALLFACSTEKPKKMDLRVVAKAGDIEFTVYDLDCYMIKSNFKNPDDEYTKKINFLEPHMEKLIVANAGYKLGLQDSIEVDSSQSDRIIYEIVYKRYISDKLDLSDENIYKFWQKYGGEVHLGQIMVQDTILADSLYQVLQDTPERFEELAREKSEEPITREKGGDLGWRRVIDIPEALHETSFNLEMGKISKPISSPYGIHLIKKYDERNTGEEAFESEKDRYRQTYNAIERKRLEEKFLEFAGEKVNYKINWDNLQVIIDKAKQLREERFGLDQPLSFCISADYLTTEEKELSVASLNDFEYDAAQFLTEMKRVHQREGLNFDKKNLVKQALDSFLLPRVMKCYGKQMNVMNSPEFEYQYKQTIVGYVYQKYAREYLLDTIKIEQQEVEAAYERTKFNYRIPHQIKCSEIHVETEAEAKDILKQLKKGVPFDELVKKTIRPGFIETKGNLGPCSERKYAPIYNAARGMRIGQYAGPIAFDGKWSVVKITDIIPEYYKPLSEVENQVRTMLLGQRKYNVYHDWVDKQKEEIDYFIDYDLIKENLVTGKVSDEI